jgi:hypothetical protein
MGKTIQAILARWRRTHGVWHVIVLGDGYEEEQHVLLGGSLSQEMAETMARIKVAQAHGDHHRNFFVKESWHEG